MAKGNTNPNPNQNPQPIQQKMVQCPECDGDVPIDERDDCPQCGLNVQKILDKDRYDRAYDRLKKKREEEEGKPNKKKGSSGEGWGL